MNYGFYMKSANVLGKLCKCKCKWCFRFWLKGMKMTLWYAKWRLGLDLGLDIDVIGGCMQVGSCKGWYEKVDNDI